KVASGFRTRSCAPKKGGGAPIGAPSMSAPHDRLSPSDRCAAVREPLAFRRSAAAGRTHPPLAQLQFPRFLRPDLAGVTRFDLSRVYRAPRRPVIVPAERWPRAARERFARQFAADLASLCADTAFWAMANKCLQIGHYLLHASGRSYALNSVSSL